MLLNLIEKQQQEMQENSLPLFIEMAIDFNTGETISKDGELVKLTGKEALNVWIWKTLKTERNRFKAYSSSFGSDIHKEIGYVYDRTVKEQLIASEIVDTLIVNPYILRVYDFEIDYSDESLTLNIKFKVDSIYGVAEQGVDNIAI